MTNTTETTTANAATTNRKNARRKGLGRGLVLALLAGSWISTTLPSSAHARWDDNPDPTDEDGGGSGQDTGVGSTTWTGAKSGFDWRTRDRAALWVGAWNDYQEEDPEDIYWSPNVGEFYDPAYVHPESFTLDFMGCVASTDFDASVEGKPAQYRYDWTVDGVARDSQRDCLISFEFPGEGLHQVKVEAFDPATGSLVQSHVEDVRVEDLLVVVMGDSFASGEGVPDTGDASHTATGEATWVDRRCHRSTSAGPVLAATELEAADPHTSVTFLSFACSGATLEREYEGEGSGVLGAYVGIETTDAYDDMDDDPWTGIPFDYSLNDIETTVRPQVDQLATAIRHNDPSTPWNDDRTVDALVLSAGLNDVHFSNMLGTCVMTEECWGATVEDTEGVSWNLETRTENYFADLADGYIELGEQLSERGVSVANKFSMEYPSPFTGPTGNCASVLEDSIESFGEVVALVLGDLVLGPIFSALGEKPWDNFVAGSDVDSAEVDWLQDVVFPQGAIAFRDAQTAGGFTQVGGINQRFIGRGYCAGKDALINTASHSANWQGPYSSFVEGIGINVRTAGTMHPNYGGHVVVGEQIAKSLLPLVVHGVPTTKHDLYSMIEDTTISTSNADKSSYKSLNFNDASGIDGISVTVPSATASVGTFEFVSNGGFTYTPPADFNGVVTIDYLACNGFTCAPGSGTISVSPAPDDVVAIADTFSVTKGQSTVLDVRANDRNPDGQATIISTGAQPRGAGTVTTDGSTITFTAPANAQPGSKFTFSYDLHGDWNTSHTTVTVKVG